MKGGGGAGGGGAGLRILMFRLNLKPMPEVSSNPARPEPEVLTSSCPNFEAFALS